jgi:hypothetical protein
MGMLGSFACHYATAKNPGKLKHLVLLLEHLGTNESEIFFTYV